MVRRREEEEAEQLKKTLCALCGRVLAHNAYELAKYAKHLDPYYVAKMVTDMLRCAEQAEEVCECKDMKELVDYFESAIRDWVVEGIEESQGIAVKYAKEIMNKVRECKLI